MFNEGMAFYPSPRRVVYGPAASFSDNDSDEKSGNDERKAPLIEVDGELIDLPDPMAKPPRLSRSPEAIASPSQVSAKEVIGMAVYIFIFVILWVRIIGV
jgi:hypothetical protein